MRVWSTAFRRSYWNKSRLKAELRTKAVEIEE